MLDCKQIGQKIHDLRIENGFKQEDLSEKLFVSRQAVSRWEVGLALPSVDNLAELCKLFSVSFEELLCLDREPVVNKKDIFEGHDRLFVVKGICEGTIKVDLAEEFYRFSSEERMMILRSVKKKKKTVGENLWVRLTRAEQRFLLREI